MRMFYRYFKCAEKIRNNVVEELNTMISDLGLTLFHINRDLYTYLQNVYYMYEDDMYTKRL
jgi:hypothetical protein